MSIAGSCAVVDKQWRRRDEFMIDHGADDRREPNGHQWSVIVGAGKRKPRSTYKLCTTTLWDEMLVETSSTPSR